MQESASSSAIWLAVGQISRLSGLALNLIGFQLWVALLWDSLDRACSAMASRTPSTELQVPVRSRSSLDVPLKLAPPVRQEALPAEVKWNCLATV